MTINWRSHALCGHWRPALARISSAIVAPGASMPLHTSNAARATVAGATGGAAPHASARAYGEQPRRTGAIALPSNCCTRLSPHAVHLLLDDVRHMADCVAAEGQNVPPWRHYQTISKTKRAFLQHCRGKRNNGGAFKQ